jgi:hypothetical protein
VVKRDEASEFRVAKEILRGKFLVQRGKRVRDKEKQFDKELRKAGSLGIKQNFGRD